MADKPRTPAKSAWNLSNSSSSSSLSGLSSSSTSTKETKLPTTVPQVIKSSEDYNSLRNDINELKSMVLSLVKSMASDIWHEFLRKE